VLWYIKVAGIHRWASVETSIIHTPTEGGRETEKESAREIANVRALE